METKTRYIIIGGWLVILSIILLNLTSAQENVVEKTLKKYAVKASTQLNIEAKYSHIDVRDWNKNEIQVEATITLFNISKQKGEQILDEISIDFWQEGDVIHVATNFEESFFKSFGWNHNEDDFKIEIVVMMPSDVKVDIENKYGSLFVNKLTSQSVLRVKYGSLKINELLAKGKGEMAEVDLGYSKGSIENCKWLKVNIKYSKIDIENSKALIVVSKYSKVNIDEASSIVCESKYDTYVTGNATNFVCEAGYSNFKFDKIRKKIHLETKYTDVKADYIPPTFESISIDNSYGSISLYIDPEASYRLNGYAKYAKIHYPDNARVNRVQENNELTVKGTIGGEKGELPTVKIETKYGGIKLSR
ncbi:MAG: DUF4097 family beta strand repeat protein [Bacteroidales bacterium]|nr:DUF4097 family beta strand repeat protein [Bacteroidales bacterium]